MYKNIGETFIKNNIVLDKSEFDFDLHNDNIAYEVMRVISSEVLFLEGHLNRLKETMESLSYDISIIEEIKKNIDLIIDNHRGLNKNLKLDVYRENNECNYRIYFVESFYPDKKLYDEGVDTISSEITRNHPHLKILNMDYKKHISDLKGDKYFEVLLINKDGYITEGSRANLLFVKGDTIYSTPRGEILEGVTLINILKIAKELKYDIKYANIELDNIKEFDACFLTGTSLGVIPIKLIDKISFNSSKNNIVLDLLNYMNEKNRG